MDAWSLNIVDRVEGGGGAGSAHPDGVATSTERALESDIRAKKKEIEVQNVRSWVVALALVAIVGSVLYVPWGVQTIFFSSFGPTVSVSARVVYTWLWDQPGSGDNQTFTLLWGHVLLQITAIIAAGALGWRLAPRIRDFLAADEAFSGKQ